MTKPQTLLLALVLPLFMLPEGMTLCLRRLLGEPRVASCCATCCQRRKEANSRESVGVPHGVNCCLALPTTQRTVEPTTRKSSDDAIAAATPVAIAPTYALVATPDLSADLAAFASRALHPPPTLPLWSSSLPLRL